MSIVVNGPLFPLLCDYIKGPNASQTVDKKLFSRLLQCPEADVMDALHLDRPADRLKDVVDQVHFSGFKLEAGWMLLSSHHVHPAVATLNSALDYMKMKLSDFTS